MANEAPKFVSIESLTTPQLQQLDNAITTGNYTDDDKALLNSLDTESLSKLDEMSNAIHSPKDPHAAANADPALNQVLSGATGVVHGSLHGADAIKDLGANIAGYAVNNDPVFRMLPQGVKDTVNKFGSDVKGAVGATLKQYDNSLMNDPIRQQAIAANQQPFAIGAAAGDIGTQTALLSGPTKAITEGIESLPAINGLSAVGKGALSQGLLGAGMGAANDPEHPFRGALVGFLFGAGTGAATGSAGQYVTRAADTLKATDEDLVKAGTPLNSLDAFKKRQENVIDGGSVYRKEAHEQNTRNKIDAQLDELRTSSFRPNESPTEAIVNYGKENIPKTLEQNTANYAPINANTQTFTPKNFNAALDDVSGGLPQLTLPKTVVDGKASTVVPSEMTLNQLLAYQTQFRNVVTQAENLAQSGKISNLDLKTVYQARDALKQDINQAADSIPYKSPTNPEINTLGDQLRIAQEFNATRVQPLNVIKKDGSPVSEKTASALWTRVAKDLKSKSPDYTRLETDMNMLGPEGKEKVIHGILEQSVYKATTPGEEYNPSKTDAALTMAKEIINKYGTPLQKKVAKGISEAAASYKRSIPKAAPAPGVFGKALQWAVTSSLGMGMLRLIGSSHPVPAHLRDYAQQLITAYIAQNRTNPNQ